MDSTGSNAIPRELVRRRRNFVRSAVRDRSVGLFRFTQVRNRTGQSRSVTPGGRPWRVRGTTHVSVTGIPGRRVSLTVGTDGPESGSVRADGNRWIYHGIRVPDVSGPKVEVVVAERRRIVPDGTVPAPGEVHPTFDYPDAVAGAVKSLLYL